MTLPSDLEHLRDIAAGLAATHPLVLRLLLLQSDAAQIARSAPRQWVAVVARRDRKTEAELVRAIEEAAPGPTEVFIVDERSYRIRERSPSMAAALRQAITLYVRPPGEPRGRSP